jgi:hypothetical protein
MHRRGYQHGSDLHLPPLAAFETCVEAAARYFTKQQ